MLPPKAIPVLSFIGKFFTETVAVSCYRDLQFENTYLNNRIKNSEKQIVELTQKLRHSDILLKENSSRIKELLELSEKSLQDIFEGAASYGRLSTDSESKLNNLNETIANLTLEKDKLTLKLKNNDILKSNLDKDYLILAELLNKKESQCANLITRLEAKDDGMKKIHDQLEQKTLLIKTLLEEKASSVAKKDDESDNTYRANNLLNLEIERLNKLLNIEYARKVFKSTRSNAALTKAEVLEIMVMVNEGLSKSGAPDFIAIAEKMNITISTAENIAWGKSYNKWTNIY